MRVRNRRAEEPEDELSTLSSSSGTGDLSELKTPYWRAAAPAAVSATGAAAGRGRCSSLTSRSEVRGQLWRRAMLPNVCAPMPAKACGYVRRRLHRSFGRRGGGFGQGFRQF